MIFIVEKIIYSELKNIVTLEQITFFKKILKKIPKFAC